MRIYTTCREAIKETERDLWELGIEVRGDSMQDKIVTGDEAYFTKELSPYTFQITDPIGDMDELIKYLFPDDHERMLNWCKEEIEERVAIQFLENDVDLKGVVSQRLQGQNR